MASTVYEVVVEGWTVTTAKFVVEKCLSTL